MGELFHPHDVSPSALLLHSRQQQDHSGYLGQTAHVHLRPLAIRAGTGRSPHSFARALFGGGLESGSTIMHKFGCCIRGRAVAVNQQQRDADVGTDTERDRALRATQRSIVAPLFLLLVLCYSAGALAPTHALFIIVRARVCVCECASTILILSSPKASCQPESKREREQQLIT
jgi:hypothetical protein